MIKGRSFWLGSNSIIVTLVMLGIIWFSSVLLGKLSLKYDTTENKQYSLSPQTKSVIKNVKDKITITAFVRKGSPQGKYIEEMLKDFSKMNSNAAVEVIDPEIDPSKAIKYQIKAANTVIFEYGANKKQVEEREIFVVDYSNRQQPDVQNFGEQAFINAILTITEKKQKVITFTFGHKEKDLDSGEADGLSEIKKSLEGDNYQVKKVNILKEGKIPEDTDILVVAGPANPFSAQEAEFIKKFLLTGKNGIILLDPLVNSGLSPLLDHWDIKLDNNIVVDPRQCLSIPPILVDPMSPIPSFKGHQITDPFEKAGSVIFLTLTRSLTSSGKKFDQRNVTKEDLLESSASSWGETDFKNSRPKYDAGADKKGPLTLAVAVTEKVKGDPKKDEMLDMKLLVVGCSNFITNTPGRVQGPRDNADFFLNSVNWMMKQTEKISIRPKKAEMRMMPPMKPWTSKLILWITLIITPLLIIAAGIAVWWLRRSK
jgi:ABC-type uncharacterized transport system involved in gliding motility auxiliary subunit